VGLIQGTPVLNYPFGSGEVSVRIIRSRPTIREQSGMRRLDAKIGSADAVMLDGDYRDALDVTKLVVLTWRLSDGRWARVIGMDALTRDDVLRLARGLRPGTTPAGRPPVTLALAPAGYDLVHLDVRSLCLAPRGAVDEISTSVCVGWGPYELRGAESLRVRGQEADLLAYENVIELRVKVRPGVTLQVSAHDLTREDVIRIAEGATVNG
jgi:hypothetical protein